MGGWKFEAKSLAAALCHVVAYVALLSAVPDPCIAQSADPVPTIQSGADLRKTIPRAFVEFPEYLNLALEEGIEEPDAMIREGLRFLQEDQRRVIKAYLTDLLDRAPSGKELQAIWSACNSYFDFRDAEHLRSFLKRIRDLS